jgi:putative ABC transport system substrate-binding protein
VIVTTGGGAAALAAHATTTTIPIVFVNGVDPVTSGLVMNLNRPGGNATGVYILQQVLEGKRLGLLHGLVPTARLIAVLLNPTNANFQTQLRGVQEAARALGQQVSILSASTERDIDIAFATVTASGAGALLVGSDPFFNSERDQLVALAARHAIPAIYEGREFAMAGGLASYGASLANAYRQAAIYAGRILRGEKPADLPIVRQQVRVRDQPEDCEDAWPRRAARAVIECRRDHRMRPFDPVRFGSFPMRVDFSGT